MFVKQNVIELAKKEEKKPIYSYYKKIMERPIPTERLINDSIFLKYHSASFYDSIINNILNPTGSTINSGLTRFSSRSSSYARRPASGKPQPASVPRVPS